MPKMQKIKMQNANSIEKYIQYFETGCIQFNKIFIQLGNSGFDQGYIENAKDCKGIFERIVLPTPIFLMLGLLLLLLLLFIMQI